MSGELLVMPSQTVQQTPDVDVPSLDELELMQVSLEQVLTAC